MEKTKIKTKLKVNDTVAVISGKDRGSKGKILSMDLIKGRIVVEGVNKVKKTVKKTQENQTGGFMTQELPIHISNVMFVDDASGKRVRLGLKRDPNNPKQIERVPRVKSKAK